MTAWRYRSMPLTAALRAQLSGTCWPQSAPFACNLFAGQVLICSDGTSWPRDRVLMPVDDEATFDAFVHRASGRLLRAGWLLTGDWQGAEDLVQAALEKTWPRWSAPTGDGGRLAYTRRVMMTTFLRGARRRWTGEIATETLPETAVDGGFDEAVISASLPAATSKLPAKQRACVVLRYFLDLSEADTASAMGSSVGAVKSNTARALDALRRDPTIGGLVDGTRPSSAGSSMPVAADDQREGVRGDG
jgi:RNA polymerase sigma-70 factor (sigma-E family)